MQEQEKIPVWVQIVNGKTVCICHRGRKGCKKPCEKDVVTRDKFAGWQGIVIDSAAEKVLSGGGGICCGLDDPIFRLVSFLFFW